MLCMMEALMPSVGTPVPSPAVLAVSHCPSEFKLEKVSRTFSEELSDVKHFQLHTYTESTDPSMLSNQAALVLETPFISISDDGKMWNFVFYKKKSIDFSEENGIASLSALSDTGVDSHAEEENKTSLQLKVSSSPLPKTSVLGWDEPIFKLKLIGQMHLISSTVTTLAVPAPSLTATLTGGGNDPAVAVPLVALATQGGCIEVVDVAANAVATSFSVHNSSVRGLRWLGNSRLVSFSYTQVNEKGGGYINRLAVTCVRSGLSRFFRVLQKPERAPMRALRASPSGRYLLILFREAPVEVWAMTRNPQMLRSLALPFTVMEWALPPVPKPPKKGSSRQSLFAKERPTIASTVAAASANSSSADSRSATMEGSADETAESFAFALVNGSLGVFELRGRRVRDFRPKWPSTSFVSSDVLVTAMAYRMPHVVMGDRSGNIRWWDVTSGLSSSFNSHRGGIRRIKFAPVVFGDQSRGRVAVLFNDNTFSIFDLDTQDPLANAILQPQFAGILVLELDWFPLRFDKKEPLLLCIAGADSSFRLLEVNTQGSRSVHGYEVKTIKERFRPMPLCSPALLPPPHALPCQGLDVMPSEQGALLASAMERISWHEKLGGEDATQKRVHELVSVGNLEAAVTLLLSTPPESPYFYVDALRAVALSSAVSSALHELAVKVVAANMVGTDKSLSGTHLLCAVGRYQEACSQASEVVMGLKNELMHAFVREKHDQIFHVVFEAAAFVREA